MQLFLASKKRITAYYTNWNVSQVTRVIKIWLLFKAEYLPQVSQSFVHIIWY